MIGPLRGVSKAENAEVGGAALLAEGVYRTRLERVQGLRDRQAEYMASLPTDPETVMRAARECLHPKTDGVRESYPKGFEEGFHLAHALFALVQVSEDWADTDFFRESALYIGHRLATSMRTAAGEIDYLSDLLSSPERKQSLGAGQ